MEPIKTPSKRISEKELGQIAKWLTPDDRFDMSCPTFNVIPLEADEWVIVLLREAAKAAQNGQEVTALVRRAMAMQECVKHRAMLEADGTADEQVDWLDFISQVLDDLTHEDESLFYLKGWEKSGQYSFVAFLKPIFEQEAK